MNWELSKRRHFVGFDFGRINVKGGLLNEEGNYKEGRKVLGMG